MCSIRGGERWWVEGRAGETFTPTFQFCVTDDPLNSSEGIKEIYVNIIKVSSMQFSPLLIERLKLRPFAELAALTCCSLTFGPAAKYDLSY